jgi:DNA-binding NtrC family response regulator
VDPAPAGSSNGKSRGNGKSAGKLAEDAVAVPAGSGADESELEAEGGAINGSFKTAVADLEKRLILEALERAGGNRSKAAEELGIYRRLLYAKLREYGLGE